MFGGGRREAKMLAASFVQGTWVGAFLLVGIVNSQRENAASAVSEYHVVGSCVFVCNKSWVLASVSLSTEANVLYLLAKELVINISK